MQQDNPSATSSRVATPELHLRTLFVLNSKRIISTIEPEPASPAPLFALIRSASSCAWAIRADVPDDKADELDRIAREEPPAADLRLPPITRNDTKSLVGGQVWVGPAFEFPEQITQATGI